MVAQQTLLRLLAPHDTGRDDEDDARQIPLAGLVVEGARAPASANASPTHAIALTPSRSMVSSNSVGVERPSFERDDASAGRHRRQRGEHPGAVHQRRGRDDDPSGRDAHLADLVEIGLATEVHAARRVQVREQIVELPHHALRHAGGAARCRAAGDRRRPARARARSARSAEAAAFS